MAAPLCKCGCGQPVERSKSKKGWNKFLPGHWSRTPEGRAKFGLYSVSSNPKKRAATQKAERMKKLSVWIDPEKLEKLEERGEIE